MDTRRLTNGTALAKGRLLWSEVQAELREFDEVMQNALAAEVATQRMKVDHVGKIQKIHDWHYPVWISRSSLHSFIATRPISLSRRLVRPRSFYAM